MSMTGGRAKMGAYMLVGHMRRGRARTVGFLVASLVALLCVVLVVPAGAESAGAARPSAGSAASLASFETALGNLQKRSASNYRDRFAGLIMDEASGTATLFVTPGPDVANQLLQGFEDDASKVHVASRPTALATLQAGVEKMAADFPILRSSGLLITRAGVDIAANVIDVRVQNPGSATTAALQARYPGLPIAVSYGNLAERASCTSRSNCLDGLRGGLSISDLQHQCTSGFEATRAGKAVMLTAGHCFANGANVRHANVAIGTVAGRTWPADGTNGNVTVDGEYIPENIAWGGKSFGVIYYDANMNNYPLYSLQGQAAQGVKDPATEVVGTGAAHSGITTGTHNGTLTQVNIAVAIANDPDGASVVTINNARALNACTLPGDSGGPVFGGDLGYGVMTAASFPRTQAGAPYCDATTTGYYMPLITLVRQFGATVRVHA